MLQNGRVRKKGARKLERCSKSTKANHILKNVRSKSVAFRMKKYDCVIFPTIGQLIKNATTNTNLQEKNFMNINENWWKR